MGGGGFSMEPGNLLLDSYIIGKARVRNPKVCFLPTVSGDADGYVQKFYSAMAEHECTACHLPLFRQPKDWREILASSDVIYVGGGNTRNMLAIWKESGVLPLISDAYDRGVVLCGLSAGAICWFEYGHTDSTGCLSGMSCLGYLKGSCSPHYDGEAERRPSYRDLMSRGLMPSGYGLEDGAALFFEDANLVEAVSSRPHAKAYEVRQDGLGFAEVALPVRYLGSIS